MNNTQFKISGRIWIDCNSESFLGQGKIEIIEKIKELGSLRKAAAEMKMSYRQAWLNINKMNQLAPKPLVILKRGGKDGGIAQITEFGEKILLTFQNIQADFENFIKIQSRKIDF